MEKDIKDMIVPIEKRDKKKGIIKIVVFYAFIISVFATIIIGVRNIQIKNSQEQEIKKSIKLTELTQTAGVSYIINSGSIMINNDEGLYFFSTERLTDIANCPLDFRKAAPEVIKKINENPVLNIEKEITALLSAFFHDEIEACKEEVKDIEEFIGDEKITLK